MSILINNELIWISIPRCASVSIEEKLLNSNLNIRCIVDYKKIIEKYNNDNNQPTHFHYPVTELYEKFGHKDTICINRDWFERWLSSLTHLIFTIKHENFTPKIEIEDINNEFIFKTFDVNFLNDLHSIDDEKLLKCYSKFIKDDFSLVKEKSLKYKSIMMFLSQNYWKNNEKCTYEFDFNRIEKFEKFMEEKYNIEFKLPFLNTKEKLNNNIIVNDNLKNWVWNSFESIFVKSNKIL